VEKWKSALFIGPFVGGEGRQGGASFPWMETMAPRVLDSRMDFSDGPALFFARAFLSGAGLAAAGASSSPLEAATAALMSTSLSPTSISASSS